MFLSNDISAESRSADDDFWYQPIGGSMMTASGQRVSSEQAMRLTAVLACVRVLAETVGQVPLHMYRRLDGDGKEKARNHPLYTVLHRRPNQWQTSVEWREMMQGHASLRGNAYSKILPGPRGSVDQLIPMHPDRTQVRIQDDGLPLYLYKDLKGQEERLLFGEVFHLRGLSSDGYIGLNPIEAEREAVGAALAAQEYGARFYQNNARPGGVIEYPGKFADKGARDKFRSSFQEAQTGLHRHKTAILERGMKYKELSVTNKDAQFLETRRFNVEEIARMFRVPPVLIGHEGKTQSFASIEQLILSFTKFTMAPIYTRWEQAISRDLIIAEDVYFAEFNVDGLLRGDSKARSEFYAKALGSGGSPAWMVRNEIRKKENLNPILGWDEPMDPSNMQNANNQRAQVLNEKAAARVVVKETAALAKSYDRCLKDNAPDKQADAYRSAVREFYTSHSKYVADVMTIGYMAADNYVYDSMQEILSTLDQEIETSEPAVKKLLQDWEATKADKLAKLGEENNV